nr:MAG TPA_asm: hypothetical protein [Bacteriophage sp.]
MHFSKNMDKIFPTMGFVCLPLMSPRTRRRAG